MVMSQPLAFVVDDDVSLGTAFKTALEMCGFGVELIDDSEVALRRIVEQMPDVIMLDIQMPKISGSEILRSLRSDEKLARLKVIVVTANSLMAQDETINDLADLVLLKPVSLTQIVDFASRLTQSEDQNQDKDHDDSASDGTR
jgi:CheY-like chemotaxis protein